MISWRNKSALRVLALLALLIVSKAELLAENPIELDPHQIDATHIGPSLDIAARWLAHEGDSASYADPHLDDSRWQIISSKISIKKYFQDADQLWYRTHVRVASHSHHVGLLFSFFGGSHQVFVNGTQVGGPSVLPLGGTLTLQVSEPVIVIPDSLLGDGELTIAVRAHVGNYLKRNGQAGFQGSPLLIGPAKELEDSLHLFRFREFSSNFTLIELDLLLLFTALGLALNLRTDHEYLALTIFAASSLFVDMLIVFTSIEGLVFYGHVRLLSGFGTLAWRIAFLEFCRLVLGFRRSRALIVYEWTYIACASLLAIADAILSGSIHASLRDHFFSIKPVADELLSIPFQVGLPLVAIWAWRKRKNIEALLLLVPLSVGLTYDMISFVLAVLYQLGLSPIFEPGSIPIPFFAAQWREFDQFIYLFTLLIFVVLRALRIARSRAFLAGEVKAAQTIQTLLLARSSDPTPGFMIESVYLPASDVGGDFFLILPAADGALIAVFGDVSGKGLLAAMRVSMILGVLRRESSRQPSIILANLNQALLTQGEMGFTTACCVHLAQGGHFTLANAGQISPYIGGREVETPPGLPLGLNPDQEYPEIAGRLSASETLVFTSDGVVEARNSQGELYGFDRLGPLTRLPAQQIATTAQIFGQDDDITVLTLACTTLA